MKHEIEIEGLPEGWKAVAYRRPKKSEQYFDPAKDLVITAPADYYYQAYCIVEKIPPRRIVLEETGEFRKAKPNEYYEYCGGISQNNRCTDSVGEYKIWRVVEEVERSSTTFRERVVNDLKHNKIIRGGE